MARASDWVDDILPHCAQAPIPEIEDCVRRAVIQFCRDSHFWRDSLNVTLVADQTEYRLRPRSGRVEKILRAQYQDTRYGLQELNHGQWSHVSSPGYDMGSAIPRFFGMSPNHERVAIAPAPDSTDDPVLKLYVALAPTRAGTEIPDAVFEEWFEAIIHGALYYLYRTPNKRWSSQARAREERFEFNTLINAASAESRTDGWAPVVTKMRQFI